jgi:GTPase SAR1 family protein
MHPQGTVAKVLVIGDVYTGKTSLIRRCRHTLEMDVPCFEPAMMRLRYAKNQFVEDYQTTIGN